MSNLITLPDCTCGHAGADGAHLSECAVPVAIWKWIEARDAEPTQDGLIPLRDALAAVRYTCGTPETRFGEGWHMAMMRAEARLRRVDVTELVICTRCGTGCLDYRQEGDARLCLCCVSDLPPTWRSGPPTGPGWYVVDIRTAHTTVTAPAVVGCSDHGLGLQVRVAGYGAMATATVYRHYPIARAQQSS